MTVANGLRWGAAAAPDPVTSPTQFIDGGLGRRWRLAGTTHRSGRARIEVEQRAGSLPTGDQPAFLLAALARLCAIG